MPCSKALQKTALDHMHFGSETSCITGGNHRSHLYFQPGDRLHVCALQYRQIAGFKPNLLRGKNLWPPIYAKVLDITTPTAPQGRYLIPVKLWSNTEWGQVSAHLTGLRIDGQSMFHR
jgi:hypothetical protein